MRAAAIAGLVLSLAFSSGCAMQRKNPPLVAGDAAGLVSSGGTLADGLSIQQLGGPFVKLVEPGTRVPFSRVERFDVWDGQVEVIFALFRGTEPDPAKSPLIGTYRVSGFPPAPRLLPRIEVYVEVNERKEILLSAFDLRENEFVRVDRIDGARAPR